MCLYVVVILVTTIFFYYNLGISEFPDYNGYVLMAQGVGAGYFTEYITQWLLQLGYVGSISTDPVMPLSIGSNAIVVTMLLYVMTRRTKHAYSIAVYCSLYLPLFLTSVLRAAPLYVFTFVFFLLFKNRSIWASIIPVATFGIFFHDTVILLTLALVAAGVLAKYVPRQNYGSIFFVILFLFVVFTLLPGGLPGLVFESLGARMVYFEGDNEGTATKVIYLIFVLYASYQFVYDANISSDERAVLISMLAFTVILYLVSSTLAVRFSTLAVGYIIAVRGVLFFKFEKAGNNPLVLLPLLATLYFLRFTMLV